ncbi:MAG: flagellar basal body-associated FliL family protein [bacterium]|nr:flagellar basal body-associated FliL family protein [bacterium]
MAEEPEEQGEVVPVGPSPKPGRYLMLIVMILVMEAVGGYLLLDWAVPAPEQPAQEEEEPKEKKPERVKPKYYTEIKKMVINLATARGNNLVQVDFALEVDSDAALEELEIKHDMIWDMILQALETHSLKEIRDPKKPAVRKSIQTRINAELKNGAVTGVYFTDIVVQ